MDKFRSKVNIITIIVNALLYLTLFVIVLIKNKELLLIVSILILICIGLLVYKFLQYKYFFDDKGLIIKDKKENVLILYKDIKFIEKNTSEMGLLYGYGLKRILVATGTGSSQKYLISPEKEDEFILELENRVEKAKKAQNKNR